MKSDNPAAFAVKELEEMYAGSEQEIGTASVRLFVAFYNGLPYDLSTDIYLPESAAALLRARNLSSEQAAYLAAHTVPNPGAAPQATQAPASRVLHHRYTACDAACDQHRSCRQRINHIRRFAQLGCFKRDD